MTCHCERDRLINITRMVVTIHWEGSQKNALPLLLFIEAIALCVENNSCRDQM